MSFKLVCYYLDTICYDDACHLKRFACNPVSSSLSGTAVDIASKEIVCDRFHFKNHTDAWCKKHCNPYTCKSLKVNCSNILSTILVNVDRCIVEST